MEDLDITEITPESLLQEQLQKAIVMSDKIAVEVAIKAGADVGGFVHVNITSKKLRVIEHAKFVYNNNPNTETKEVRNLIIVRLAEKLLLTKTKNAAIVHKLARGKRKTRKKTSVPIKDVETAEKTLFRPKTPIANNGADGINYKPKDIAVVTRAKKSKRTMANKN